MLRAQANTLIAAPTDRVFEFIAVDFYANYKRWAPEVISLTRLTDGPMGIGSTAKQVRIDRGRRSESTFRVSVFEPGKRVDFQGISTPFHVSYRFAEQLEHTHLTFVFELTRLELYMRPFEKLIRGAMDEGAKRTVDNIKALIERELATS